MTLLSVPAVTARMALAVSHIHRTDRKEITVKLPILLIITTVLILSFACASEQQGAGRDGNDPRGFILEDADKINIENYKAKLDNDDIPFVLRKGKTAEAFRERTESAALAFGEQIGRIDQAVIVDSPRGYYFIYTGEFDFEVFANHLNSSPRMSPVEDWFQPGVDAWFEQNDHNMVLFPQHGLLIIGNRGALTALREVFSEGTGFAEDSSGLGKLLYRTDLDGFESEINSDCSLTEDSNLVLEGCVGVSWALTDGGDDFAELSYEVLLDNAENAESAAPKIQEEMETTALWFGDSFEFTELDISGDIVTFKIRRSE